VRRKGVAWFVRSVMPRLPEDVVLLVVGEGPEMADIAQAIDERGLNNRVRLAGRVDESMLMRALAGSDVFVMPNIPVAGDMEGFGVVMLEAGLLDLPTVASGIEGILDVITDGVNGLLVAPGDAEGFAEAIRRCLSATALADDRATGGNGTASAAFAPGSIRAHVRSTFSWDAVSGRYLAALRS
jgi:phosphatidylinositol alpha-1,6-mannosyltransferase